MASNDTNTKQLESHYLASLDMSVFQLIFFGKGSCNFSGGSHKVLYFDL